MRHRLPTLSALRAFEAAARHESMTLAGEELLVSPGAVSRHVGVLEAHFKRPLFYRRQHGLELTDKGRHFYNELAAAFDRIDGACESMIGKTDTESLRVRIFTTLATEWLLPRLPEFNRQFPDIEVSLNVSWRSVPSEFEDTDIVIRIGRIAGNEFGQERLFSPIYFPVCAPQLLERDPTLKDPADLSNYTLLLAQPQIRHWKRWLIEAGVSGIELDRGVTFDDSSLAYKAARAGAGVALGQKFFNADDLKSGQLVAPFDLCIQSPQSYHLVYQERRANEEHIRSFCDWFIAEISKSQQEIDELLPNLLPNSDATS